MILDESILLTLPTSKRHVSINGQIIISSLYIFGIIGNFTALIIIARREKRRFHKQAREVEINENVTYVYIQSA